MLLSFKTQYVDLEIGVITNTFLFLRHVIEYQYNSWEVQEDGSHQLKKQNNQLLKVGVKNKNDKHCHNLITCK